MFILRQISEVASSVISLSCYPVQFHGVACLPMKLDLFVEVWMSRHNCASLQCISNHHRVRYSKVQAHGVSTLCNLR